MSELWKAWQRLQAAGRDFKTAKAEVRFIRQQLASLETLDRCSPAYRDRMLPLVAAIGRAGTADV